MAKTYCSCNVVNFPIDFIPMIIEDVETLRNECLDYGFAYFLKCFNKNTFKDSDIEYVAKLFEVKLGNKAKTLQSMTRLWGEYGNKRKPHTHISRNKLWHFVNKYTTDEELAALALLLAMRSIGRVGLETHSTLDLLCARMKGQAKPSETPPRRKNTTKNGIDVDGFVERWMRNPRNRRKLQKMLADTENIEFPKGHSRGIKWREKKEEKQELFF